MCYQLTVPFQSAPEERFKLEGRATRFTPRPPRPFGLRRARLVPAPTDVLIDE
jgi:hypothetical protein